MVVKQTGECVDGCRTREQAKEMARDMSMAFAPCVVLRVEYEYDATPKARS